MAAPFSSCPACDAAPLAEAQAIKGRNGGMNETTATLKRVVLSLPEIHCAGCISGVEKALLRKDNVRAVRVNLTLKRATLDVVPYFDTDLAAVSGHVSDPEARADNGINQDFTKHGDTGLQNEAKDLADYLTKIGYVSYELDQGQLATSASEKQSKDLLMRLGVAGFSMMNVMLLSVAVWAGASDATRDMFHWISALIAIPTVGFSSQVFFRSALNALRGGRLNMDVPISLAILLALGMSLYETMRSGEHAYFDAALSLTFFLLAGRYLDFRTRETARSAAQELAALEVPRATRVTDGQPDQTVAISALCIGDIVRVVPGGRVPVDGVVTLGRSELDRSVLTGESLPVAVTTKSIVMAGELNLTGPLNIRVSAASKDTALRRMAELVEIAETARNKYTSLADKAAAIYAPVVHLLAFGAFLAWYFLTRDVRISMNIAVAVLIITCPCALGLAVPAVTTAASGRLFQKSMLLKSPTALERLAEVDHVVFDKTGTLTQGMPIVDDLATFSERDLGIALGLAQGSHHPLAQSLTQAISELVISEQAISAAQIDHIKEHPGQGIEGIWQGQPVRLGRSEWLGATQGSQMATYLSLNGATPVAFTFTDALRPGVKKTIAALKAKGVSVSLLSGDVPTSVQDVADRVGISDWHSAQMPEDKARFLETLKQSGKHVLMVGDGLNDTAALAGAHVSISPSSALEAARVVSDVVFLGHSLFPLIETLEVAKSARRRIKENFTIAAGYNAIAIPIALVGWASPLAAALAMSTSSVLVSLNALRLRKG